MRDLTLAVVEMEEAEVGVDGRMGDISSSTSSSSNSKISDLRHTKVTNACGEQKKVERTSAKLDRSVRPGE